MCTIYHSTLITHEIPSCFINSKTFCIPFNRMLAQGSSVILMVNYYLQFRLFFGASKLNSHTFLCFYLLVQFVMHWHFQHHHCLACTLVPYHLAFIRIAVYKSLYLQWTRRGPFAESCWDFTLLWKARIGVA